MPGHAGGHVQGLLGGGEANPAQVMTARHRLVRAAVCATWLAAAQGAAASVEIHQSHMDGSVMRMRAVEALPLPAKTTVKPMHGGEWHLMLLIRGSASTPETHHTS